jgi:hypothetical protein
MKTKIIFLLIISFLYVGTPLAHAAGLYDGGELQGQDHQCSCTGAEAIKIKSYVDNTTHIYMYQPGATELYQNYNIEASGNYFLTTLLPVAICLDASEECEGSSGQSPEGIFFLTGTSMNPNTKNFLALVNKIPGIDIASKNIAKSFSQFGSNLLFSNPQL